jgi:hypothetical protein
MKAALRMVIASLAVWLAMANWMDGRTRVAVLVGMCAPLAMAAGTWVLAERTYRANPQALTSLMVGAFGFKLVFFGVYVGAAIGLLALRPVPFVVSFVGYFVALYFAEALLLRRLFSANVTSSTKE